MNPFQFPAVILASQSPRRAELLRQMGVPFEVVIPADLHAAEALEAVITGEDPLTYVERVSRAKAQMMRQQVAENHAHPMQLHRPILCADTTVALGNEILGKPQDAQDAFEMLKKLSGQTHQVHTAIALAKDDEVWAQVVSSNVHFCTLSDALIHQYIESGEPFGKAGAYAIQGLGACFVAHLDGSFSSVKGLPVFEVAQLLRGIHEKTHPMNV